MEQQETPSSKQGSFASFAEALHLQLEVEREEMVSAEQLKKSSCLEAAGAGGNCSHWLAVCIPTAPAQAGSQGGQAKNK